MPAGPLPVATSAIDTVARPGSLRGQECRFEPLAGGLTNRSYRVSTDDGGHYVARLPSRRTALLPVDRRAERHNTTVAALAGVGPRVVDGSDDVLLVEWVDGRTLADADLADPATLERVALLCRRLHGAAPFTGRFDLFALQRRYRALVGELGFRLPEDYDSLAPAADRLASALRASAPTQVPCHNDLVAANIVDDGTRLWFIDYEYAGMSDPCFELGNLYSGAGLDTDQLEHLVTAYAGAPSPLHTARTRVFAMLTQYCWTLWASIQQAVSDVDFDFWSWGLGNYERARSQLRGPEPDRLLTAIAETTRPEGAAPWPTPR